MERIAKSYIEKRIEQTQNSDSSYFAYLQSEVTGMTREELAKYEAQKGNVTITASHLRRDETLPVSQKGEILADAYAIRAEKSTLFAEHYNLATLKIKYQREAQRSKRIAHGLTRAAKRSRDT